MKQHSIEVKKWRSKNPQKVKAQTAVNNALRYGKIQKGVCEICGSVKVEAHHTNYLQPLLIVWLCRKHHAEAHYPNKKPFEPKIVKSEGVNRRVTSTYMSLKPLCDKLKTEGNSYQQIALKVGISKSQAFKIINSTKYK